MKRTYVGILCNDRFDIKTLVLAESAGEAESKVLRQLDRGIGAAYRREEVQIIPFGPAV